MTGPQIIQPDAARPSRLLHPGPGTRAGPRFRAFTMLLCLKAVGPRSNPPDCTHREPCRVPGCPPGLGAMSGTGSHRVTDRLGAGPLDGLPGLRAVVSVFWEGGAGDMWRRLETCPVVTTWGSNWYTVAGGQGRCSGSCRVRDSPARDHPSREGQQHRAQACSGNRQRQGEGLCGSWGWGTARGSPR